MKIISSEPRSLILETGVNGGPIEVIHASISPVAGLNLWTDYPAEPIVGPNGKDVCGI